MASRRRFLQLGVSSLVASRIAGCLSDSGPLGGLDDASGSDSTDDSAPATGTDGSLRTLDDVSDWSLSFDGANVSGLDSADGGLLATVSRENGPSSVAAIDTTGQSIRWQTERMVRRSVGRTPHTSELLAVSGA